MRRIMVETELELREDFAEYKRMYGEDEAFDMAHFATKSDLDYICDALDTWGAPYGAVVRYQWRTWGNHGTAYAVAEDGRALIEALYAGDIDSVAIWYDSETGETGAYARHYDATDTVIFRAVPAKYGDVIPQLCNWLREDAQDVLARLFAKCDQVNL